MPCSHETGLLARTKASLLSIIVLSLFLSLPIAQAETVTVVNETTYPWLMKGAYADYKTLSFLGTPYFVTSNGTLLLGANLKGPAPQANATLDWMVLNRSGVLVSLSIIFHAVGCLYSQVEYNSGNCTTYDFNNTMDVIVNITSSESYVGGKSQGLLNFWEPALLDGARINAGTMFINRMRFDSLANVTSPVAGYFGGPPIEVSGSIVKGPYYSYSLTPTLFAFGTTSQFGWLNSSVTGFNGNKPITAFPIGPTGSYDYYNGLAYDFSIPDYPVNQTVCDFNNGQVVNCQIAEYSTTLGGFFRSGSGELVLISTNVALTPTQSTSPSIGDFWYLLLIAAAGSVTFFFVFRHTRLKKLHR